MSSVVGKELLAAWVRWSFYGLLALVVASCGILEFWTARSGMRSDPHGLMWSLLVTGSVVVYSGLFMVLLTSKYRPHTWLRWTIGTVMSAGLAVSGFLLLSSWTGQPVVSGIIAAAVSLTNLAFSGRKITRDMRRSLAYSAKPLHDRVHAERMVREVETTLQRYRLKPDERRTLRINLARALVARSVASASPDGLVEATDALRAVLADPPQDSELVLIAAEELVQAMSRKADKHGDLLGYPESLDLLAGAAEALPSHLGAFALVHLRTGEYELTLAERAPTAAQRDEHLDLAISDLRSGIDAVRPAGRGYLPRLYAQLGRCLGRRRSGPGALHQALTACRLGQRAARWRPGARAWADLAVAELLLGRATTVAGQAAGPGGAASGASAAPDPSVVDDLRAAERLCRRVVRKAGSDHRFAAMERLADVLSAAEQLTGTADQHGAARAWRAVARVAALMPVTDMVRVATSWVAWCERTGQPQLCAEAYQHVMSLVPRAAAARYLPAERDRLLAGVQHCAEQAGYWLAAVGQIRSAAVALEMGRAVSISEVTGRERPQLVADLAAAGQHDLLERLGAVTAELAAAEREPAAANEEYITRVQRAWAGYDAVLREVAAVKGIEAPVADVTYDDVVAAAQFGPVVYLAAADRLGFAVIVGTDQEPRWLPLPQLTRARVRAQVEQALRTSNLVAVAATLRWLWENGISDLSDSLPAGAGVTLVPVGLLSLLPLHAAGGPSETGAPPADWTFLADRVDVRYAPNARTVARARERAQACARQPLALLAVDAPTGNPGRPLRHARVEVSEIARGWRAAGYRGTTVHDAYREDVWGELPLHTVWHFACHGEAVPDDILDSSLLLEDGRLSLYALLKMPAAPRRLAVLSACQTHRSALDLPNEAMGLPGGLLQVGFAAVVASHWNVFELSVVFLMTKFYELWCGPAPSPCDALAQAQRWVRQATMADLHAYLPGMTWPHYDEQQPGSELAHARPFSHPYHWAPFAVTGL